MVVRAIKTIAEGDMINENYGPIFTQKRRETRQKILRERYWFDCRCLPCVEEWPLIDAMTDNALRFRCTERRCRKPLVVPVDTMTPFITCPSCKKSNNILKVNLVCCYVCTDTSSGDARDLHSAIMWPCGLVVNAGKKNTPMLEQRADRADGPWKILSNSGQSANEQLNLTKGMAKHAMKRARQSVMKISQHAIYHSFQKWARTPNAGFLLSSDGWLWQNYSHNAG